jgi:alkanesulfonate monooxygenase SsuD/methylene tetrahydromethanopterin reductase-like flavin-dependent oxidoreductase (luciferase family)
MKRIGFLSFGHYQDVPGSQVRTAADALLQTIELAVAAEELGVDGAFVRVHHFARQLASPFPLLAAIGARTKTCPRRARRMPTSRAGTPRCSGR